MGSPPSPLDDALPTHVGAAVFDALFARGPFGLVLVGPDERIRKVNDVFAAMLGRTPESLVGEVPATITHPDDRETAARFLRQFANGQSGMGTLTKRYLHASGAVVWAEVWAVVARLADGERVGCALVLDITARREMEEALRRSNERFASVARATNDLVYDWDIDTGNVVWSEVIVSRFRHGGDAVHDIRWWEAQLHPDDQLRVVESLTAAVDSSEELWSCEYRFRRGDGTYADVFDRATFRRDASGRAHRMVGVMVDVSELRRVQAQLRLADRLAAVGTLAAGVAHEINNPLSWVVNNLQVAKDSADRLARAIGMDRTHAGPLLPLVQRVREALGDAQDGSDRVANIVRDLKTFARPEDERRVPVSVQQVMEAALSLAQNEIRHRARVVREYADVPPVEASEARLGQVFLNLVINAAQALDEERVAQNEIRVGLRRAADGRVEATVADNGPGIPEQVVKRIFDPFFTTKAPGVGTGLGLAVCHGIVASLGGEIRVDSRPGAGTSFRALLPPAAGAAPSIVPLEAEGAPHTPQAARILVLDDEPLVGRALRRALEHHEVSLAASAREALDRLRQGERWDLILCDVMMPDMSGMDFFAALEEVAPDQCRKVAFMTGGAFTPRAAAFFGAVANPRLEKPFGGEEVERVLAEIRGRAV